MANNNHRVEASHGVDSTGNAATVVRTDNKVLVDVAGAEKSRAIGQAGNDILVTSRALQESYREIIRIAGEMRESDDNVRHVDELDALARDAQEKLLAEAVELPQVLQVIEQMGYKSLGIASGINVTIPRDSDGRRVFPTAIHAEDASRQDVEQRESSQGFVGLVLGLFGFKRKSVNRDLRYKGSTPGKYY